ncbi:MAG: putative oxidoreductase [Alphaproteobacteria bacterium MarineAlpha4_Bin2]|nr:MAG: putative oxidoreductase [Alphaproteobacteria bacterium MarineAlpha4_Bin2]
MTGSLEGKVAIITGAARGLGREYALRLATEGASIVAGDLRDCGETLKEIEASGGNGIAVTLDVTDAASCEKASQAAEDHFGRIDALINNAALYGGLKGGRFDALDPGEWDQCMAVNVTGMWNCCKAVVGAMRASGGGSIVNISSLAAVYGLPYALHYAVSKAAVIGMTRSLARELGRDWIRVNAVAPSAVMTEGTEEFFGSKLDKAKEVIANGQTLQRNLETEDLAGTIVYLAGDASKFVTGQTIMVDGGSVFL